MRATSTRLSTFYAAYFGTVGVWLPFWPVWLGSRGLDAGAIGAVLAAGFWSRVVFNPLVARVADARGERKQLMVVLSALAAVTYAAFTAAGSLWHYVLLSALVGATYTVLVPLADSLTLRVADTDGIDYGRVRLWGSLAFIVASVGSGRLLSSVDDAWILRLLIAGASLTFLACAFLPGKSLGLRVTRQPGAAARLVSRPRYLLFLATCACLQASHGVYYGFGTLHWKHAGHGDGVVGMLWAEGVVAEILLFAAGTRITRRVGPAGLFVLSSLGGVVRWGALGASTDLRVLAAVQGLHALTFAAAHLGAMSFLTRTVPEELSATAQTVYSAVVGGLALGGAVSAAGALYEHFGGEAFYFGAALSAAALPLALLLARDGQLALSPPPRPSP